MVHPWGHSYFSCRVHPPHTFWISHPLLRPANEGGRIPKYRPLGCGVPDTGSILATPESTRLLGEWQAWVSSGQRPPPSLFSTHPPPHPHRPPLTMLWPRVWAGPAVGEPAVHEVRATAIPFPLPAHLGPSTLRLPTPKCMAKDAFTTLLLP